MSNDSSNSSDSFTGRQISSIIIDWIGAVRQLEQWYKQLECEIDNRKSSYGSDTLCSTPEQRSMENLISLRYKIDSGLISLEKEVASIHQPIDVPVEMLRLIEHTQIVLQWCHEIKQRLGIW